MVLDDGPRGLDRSAARHQDGSGPGHIHALSAR